MLRIFLWGMQVSKLSFSYDSVVIPSMVECIHIAGNLKGISISAAFKRSDIDDPRQYAQV